MQNRGAILLFAVVFAIVCLYELSFTFFAKSVEQDAKVYAEEYVENESVQNFINGLASGDTSLKANIIDTTKYEKEKFYLDSMKGESVYNFYLADFTYGDCKKRELNLGLDLKGGMNVVLEISLDELVKVLAGDNSDDSLLNVAIKNALKQQRLEQEDFITLFAQEYETVGREFGLARVYKNSDAMKELINKKSTNQEVVQALESKADAAISNAFEILSKRINKFGVSQPNIKQLKTKGRILVELPGVKDKSAVRDLMTGTAKLEFWNTYKYKEISEQLKNANNVVIDLIKAEEYISKYGRDLTKAEKDSIKEAEKLAADADTTGQVAKAQEELSKKNLFQLLNHTNENRNYTSGISAESPLIGVVDEYDTVTVGKYLRNPKFIEAFTSRTKFMWEATKTDSTNGFGLIALKAASSDYGPLLDGDVIDNAGVDYGQMNIDPKITMQMNTEGSNVWADITGDEDNKGRCIAIVLDDLVYSYPRINEKISGGRSEISGNFTVEQAKVLANLLKSGSLPAPAKIVEETVVGPSLGQEAIEAGVKSFIVALILVLIYMLFYYNGAGLAANVALISNIFFIFGVLASLGATLTLPGIAGIVLTIGMSVDANVLIYERIREEIKLGKGTRLAIIDGYKNAYSSIIDANVTTLLTGVILLIFGSGPIQGFATTLIIGICTSLFSAIFITRLIFMYRMDRNQNISFDNKITAGAFKNVNFDFIGKRKLFYVISSIIIIAGIGSLATKKLDLGVDFTGGRTFTVRFDKEVNNEALKNSLKVSFDDNLPEVKTSDTKSQVKITTKYLYNDDGNDASKIVEEKLVEGIKAAGYENFEVMSSVQIGPTIADDIKKDGAMSIIFSLLIIFIYILIRFNKWQFSLGAIAAVVHDSLIVLSLFSIFYGILPFSLEIDQAFIAAMLTVIGYSINDTVVVFDRIREFMGLNRKMELKDVMNNALNSTVSRTVNTSLTTFVALLIIFLFGGDVIKGFMFALMVGVAVGTYSSLFIATPIVVDTYKVKKKIDEKRSKK